MALHNQQEQLYPGNGLNARNSNYVKALQNAIQQSILSQRSK